MSVVEAEEQPTAGSPAPEPTKLRGFARGLGREFNLLWLGQSVSNVGDKINQFVIPAVLLLLLHASPFQIGLVGMAQYAAIPLLSLLAGGLVDRWDLRWSLIWCDLIRCSVVALVPVAYWLHFLSVGLVFGVVAVANATSVFFNIAYTATISATVPPEGRVDAYSHMESSRTVAEVVGPAIASAVYVLMGAFSLLIDAATFLFSASNIRAMRPYATKPVHTDSMRTRIGIGIRLNWDDRILRGTVLGATLLNMGGPIFVTVMPILAYRGLGLSVGQLGTVMSIAAVFAVLGAFVTRRVTKFVGPARMVAWSVFLHCFVGLGVLLAPMLPSAVVLCVVLSFYGVFMVWFNVSGAAIRQARVPAANQAISQGIFRTITWGVIPFAALLGGVLVQLLSPHFGVLNAAKITMVIGTSTGVLFAWIPLAPIQSMLNREKKAAEAGELVNA
jgi:MFS family permease